MVGGVAVVGYILWKRGVFGSKKSDSKFSGFTADNNFFNATGRYAGRTRMGDDDTCPACPTTGPNAGTCWNGTFVPTNAVTLDAGIAGKKQYVSCSTGSSSGTVSARRG